MLGSRHLVRLPTVEMAEKDEQREREIEELDCKTNDTTDMTFCMANYHKNVLKVSASS